MWVTYEDLQKATPEELLEATCHHYDYVVGERTEHFTDGIRLGFKIASKNGWGQVAPAGVGEYRTVKNNNDHSEPPTNIN